MVVTGSDLWVWMGGPWPKTRGASPAAKCVWNVRESRSRHLGELQLGVGVVGVDLVARAAAEDLGFAPGDGFGEGFALDECLEVLELLPFAEDDVTAGGLDVLVEARFDVAGESLEN